MITDIRMQQFRSYEDASFEFEPGVNIIIGPNASGKTNLLEAVLVASRGKSFRVKDSELIMHEMPWARIDVDLPDAHRTVKIERLGETTEKTVEIDKVVHRRLSAQTALPTVLFEPGHLQFLVGSPEMRRDFIDGILEQIDDTYTKTWTQYRRTLTQRNTLLKQSSTITSDQFFVWDVRLSEFAAIIVQKRQRLINQINELASDTYSAIAGKRTKLVLEYVPRVLAEGYATYLHRELAKRHELDRIRGFTSVGPHREDITLSLNGFSQQLTASRGEVRTTMLALKIIEITLLESITNRSPLVLLDDVFSELDGARRKALTKHLAENQTFITTTDADVAKKQFQAAHLIAL